MEDFRRQLDKLQVKGTIIRMWNIGIIVTSFVSLLLTVIAWIVSTQQEDSGFKRRHVGSVIAFIATLATVILDIISLRIEPRAGVLYGLQLLSLLALALNAISIGMAAIVVDVCAAGEKQNSWINCPAHVLEYIAGIFLCVCLVSVFLTTQQKIVVLVDRGILQDIGSRLSRI